MQRILILGATGRVGGHVLRLLRRNAPELHLRVLTRRPSLLAAEQSNGVEVIGGSSSDAPTLVKALQEVGAVLLVTGDAPDQVTVETQIIDCAAASRTPPFMLKISAITAGLRPPVSFGRFHAAIESHLHASRLDCAILRSTFFFQSLELFGDGIRRFNRLLASTGRGRIAFVDLQDVAQAAAGLLLHRPAGQRVFSLSGPQAWSMAEVAAGLSSRLGRRIVHSQPPALAARIGMSLGSGMSWKMAGLVTELLQACARGAEEAVFDDLPRLIDTPVRTLDQYLDDRVEKFLSGP